MGSDQETSLPSRSPTFYWDFVIFKVRYSSLGSFSPFTYRLGPRQALQSPQARLREIIRGLFRHVLDSTVRGRNSARRNIGRASYYANVSGKYTL